MKKESSKKAWHFVFSVISAALAALLLKSLFDDFRYALLIAIVYVMILWAVDWKDNTATDWPYEYLSPARLALIFGSVVAIISFYYRVTNHLLVNGDAIILDASIASLITAIVLYIGLLLPQSKAWFNLGPAKTYAITSSCYPFLLSKNGDKNDTVTLFLIKNENYEQNDHNWWLPPGGHVDWDEGESPESIAEVKSLSEAGLKVINWIPQKSDSIEKDKDFQPHHPAPLNFMLRVPETSKCRGSKHHEWHYDHSFVAIVEVKGKDAPSSEYPHRYERIRVKLSLDSSEKQIKDTLEELSRDREEEYYYVYPHDLTKRIFMALEILRVHIQSGSKS